MLPQSQSLVDHDEHRRCDCHSWHVPWVNSSVAARREGVQITTTVMVTAYCQTFTSCGVPAGSTQIPLTQLYYPSRSQSAASLEICKHKTYGTTLLVHIAHRAQRFRWEALQRGRVTIKLRSATIMPNDAIPELLAVGPDIDVRCVVDDTALAEGRVRPPMRLVNNISIVLKKEVLTCKPSSDTPPHQN